MSVDRVTYRSASRVSRGARGAAPRPVRALLKATLQSLLVVIFSKRVASNFARDALASFRPACPRNLSLTLGSAETRHETRREGAFKHRGRPHGSRGHPHGCRTPTTRHDRTNDARMTRVGEVVVLKASNYVTHHSRSRRHRRRVGQTSDISSLGRCYNIATYPCTHGYMGAACYAPLIAQRLASTSAWWVLANIHQVGFWHSRYQQ
jgi:hypothetical protein